MGKFFRYAGALIAFLLVYVLVGGLAHVIVGAINSDAGGWLGEYIVPYFVAAIAGAIGAAAGLAAVERLFQTVRLRPIVWAFIAVVGLIWSVALIGVVAGTSMDEGITEMAVQIIVAIVVALKMSAPHAAESASQVRRSSAAPLRGKE